MQSQLSEKMLLRLAELKRPSYKIPTMNIFDPPNELNPLSCDWFNGLSVSSAEFISQVFIKLFLVPNLYIYVKLKLIFIINKHLDHV